MSVRVLGAVRPRVYRDHYARDAWQRQIFHTTVEAHGVIHRVIAEMQAADYGEADQFAMHVALEEAIVNAITHGNRNDPAKHVVLRYRINGEETLAEIEDQGDGFDPALIPDPTSEDRLEQPHGRGVWMMRAVMSAVRYNATGNCVTICRRRSQQIGIV